MSLQSWAKLIAKATALGKRSHQGVSQNDLVKFPSSILPLPGPSFILLYPPLSLLYPLYPPREGTAVLSQDSCCKDSLSTLPLARSPRLHFAF